MKKQQDKIVLAVVFGGQSSEHEISRISAQSVLNNIDTNLYEVRMIGITKQGEWLRYDGDIQAIGTGEWEKVARKCLLEKKQAQSKELSCTSNDSNESNSALQLFTQDSHQVQEKPIQVVFPVLHGPNGEDGSIQGLFQLSDIPYVGCGVLSSAMGMDKTFTKIALNDAGIIQAKYIKVLRNDIDRKIEEIQLDIKNKLGYPCFVKPASAGSSVGVCKVKMQSELQSALKKAAKYDHKILIEEFIDGRELECAILGNEEPVASVVGEVVPSNEFYDYQAKYFDDRSQTIIPAQVVPEISEKIRKIAIKAFQAIDASGLSRVDFFLEKETNRIVLNEINTMPGFTSISMYAKLWNASGIPYAQLVNKLVQLAMERYEFNRNENTM